ncbi:MAG: hypothetical protein NZM31_12980 [Gemmatales bacterium]|nr:hypothetical protein [Gemmatales bacterium]MDW8387910.1 hypothetical protein [Gemmatales bacterium]
MKPFDLHGLATYELQSRPSKVFVEDLGRPLDAGASFSDWLDSLPHQLAGKEIRAARDAICAACTNGRCVGVGIGGHVIKTGCGPYLIDWIRRGVVTSISMNGSAAIHDFELALVGKTSEDVAAQLPSGKFGMARETADAFAVAARIGADEGCGLGHALGRHISQAPCRYPEASVVLAAYEAGIPCTIHVALGTDIVHMHPHVSGAALGEASLIDFRWLCTIVSRLKDGVWMNLGSAVIMPEVFVKAVSVARNFGHDLDGLTAINLDKSSQYRSRVNVMERPTSTAQGRGIELIGHHEILLPLLHLAVVTRLAAGQSTSVKRAA